MVRASSRPPSASTDTVLRLGRYAQRYPWACAAIERLRNSPSRVLRTRAAPALYALAVTHRPALDDLRRMCADPDPQVREAAGYWLARCCEHDCGTLTAIRGELEGDDRVRSGVASGLAPAAAASDAAFDLLVLLALDDEGRVRAAATEALGEAGAGHPRRVVSALRDLLFFSNEPDGYIIHGAAGALARLLSAAAPGATTLMVQLAADSHDSRRWCAARALAGASRTDDPRVNRALSALARDGSLMVRGELAITAGALAAAGAGVEAQHAVPLRLLEALGRDNDGFVRSAAAEAAANFVSTRPRWALDTLARCAQASDHHARAGAAAGLAVAMAAKPESAVEVACSLTRDKWPVVRARAAASLAKAWSWSPEARQSILQLAQDSHPAVRSEAAGSLAAASDDKNVPAEVWRALESLICDDYAEVRRRAVSAVGALAAGAPERALSILAERLEDAPGPELARALALALAAHEPGPRAWGAARIAVAARSDGLMREMAEAAHDLLTADLMSVFHDIAYSEPMEDHLERLAEITRPHAHHRRAWLLKGVAEATTGMLRARTLEEFVQAYDSFPDLGKLGELLAFVPDVEDVSALLHVAEPIGSAYVASSRHDKAVHLQSAVRVMRQRLETGVASPSPLYRQISRRLLEAGSRIITAVLPSLRDQAEISVELLPARAYFDSEGSVALRLHNRGSAAAANIHVVAQADHPYAIDMQGGGRLVELSPGEEMLLPLRLIVPQAPLKGEGAIVRGSLEYDDTDGVERRMGFSCELGFKPAPGRAAPSPAHNPYAPGKPLTPDSPMFIGREDVFAFLRETLPGAYQENVVALIGPRRIGKTSILRQAEKRLGDLYWPVFVDVQGILVRDVGLLMHSLAERCRDAVAAEVKVPPAGEFAADLAVLPRFLEQLTRAAGGDKRFLIMLDEFDDFEQKVRSGLLPDTVFAYLRHFIQHSPRTGFVLSGTNRLEELGRDYWSFLFNLAIYRKVGRLQQAEAGDVVQPMAQVGIACDDLAAYRIWELSGGHPYFLQLVGHYLVSRCQRVGQPCLDYDAVETCAGDIAEWGDTHLRYLWELADTLEQAVLAAVYAAGRSGATVALIADTLRAHGCDPAPAAIARAADGLVDKDLVAAAGHAAPRYKPTMGILGTWIERSHPLPRVARSAA